jgi:hypothetical protein
MGGSAPEPGAIGLIGRVCAIAAVVMPMNRAAAAVITGRCGRRIGVSFHVARDARDARGIPLCPWRECRPRSAHDLAAIAIVGLALLPSRTAARLWTGSIRRAGAHLDCRKARTIETIADKSLRFARTTFRSVTFACLRGWR